MLTQISRRSGTSSSATSTGTAIRRPSAEIGEAVGLASPSTVHAHLANLERAGYLRRDPTKPRARARTPHGGGRGRLGPTGRARLPLVGEIAAGGPLLAEENVEDYLAVPSTLLARRRGVPARA